MQRAATWCESFYEYVHYRRISFVNGKTAVREALEKYGPHVARAALAYEHHIPIDEIRIPDVPYESCLPMALVDGPVPFAQDQVAKFTLNMLLYNRADEMKPPTDFERVSNNEFVTSVRALPGESFVRRLPNACTARDFPHVKNFGTWYEPMYDAAYLTKRIRWVVRSRDGAEFDSLETYVKHWIRAKLNDMELKRALDKEFSAKRDAFIRTIWVNKKFVNEYGDAKREYLDEYILQKKRRAARTFGTDCAEALLALPISAFGPDFEKEEEEEEQPWTATKELERRLLFFISVHAV